jgi:hypothetical protein
MRNSSENIRSGASSVKSISEPGRKLPLAREPYTIQTAAVTLCVEARVNVAKACAANSCLLRISNSISDGVNRLSSGEVPSF